MSNANGEHFPNQIRNRAPIEKKTIAVLIRTSEPYATAYQSYFAVFQLGPEIHPNILGYKSRRHPALVIRYMKRIIDGVGVCEECHQQWKQDRHRYTSLG